MRRGLSRLSLVVLGGVRGCSGKDEARDPWDLRMITCFFWWRRVAAGQYLALEPTQIDVYLVCLGSGGGKCEKCAHRTEMLVVGRGLRVVEGSGYANGEPVFAIPWGSTPVGSNLIRQGGHILRKTRRV